MTILKHFHKKAFKKNYITIKNVIALNLYIDIWISVWKKVDDESFLHDKVFVLKTIFCKNRNIFLKNVQIGNIFVVNPSPKYFNANI